MSQVSMKNEPLIQAENLVKYFPLVKGFLKKVYVRAVNDVSLRVHEKEILALVGESGSGKTTVGRLLLRLIEPDSGKVIFEGKNIYEMNRKELLDFRKKAQIVFQDPYASMNAFKTIYNIMATPLRIHKITNSKEEEIEKINKLIESVGLTPENVLYKYPRELSGGERQRICIARALSLDPKFIVTDEPVSMLDASLRAEILNLLLKFKNKNNLSFLFITHDLATARYVCDRIDVMYLGYILEEGTRDEVFLNPLHPYTQLLMSAVPVPDPKIQRKRILMQEIPSATDLPVGCPFNSRCPYVKAKCKKEIPHLLHIEGKHFVRCHLACLKK